MDPYDGYAEDLDLVVATDGPRRQDAPHKVGYVRGRARQIRARPSDVAESPRIAIVPSGPRNLAPGPSGGCGDPTAWGPPLWERFHLWTRSDPQPSAVDPWLAAFAATIPCSRCRADWERIVRSNPPDLSDLPGWGHARHNDVNRAIGKTEVAREDIERTWR